MLSNQCTWNSQALQQLNNVTQKIIPDKYLLYMGMQEYIYI